MPSDSRHNGYSRAGGASVAAHQSSGRCREFGAAEQLNDDADEPPLSTPTTHAHVHADDAARGAASSTTTSTTSSTSTSGGAPLIKEAALALLQPYHLDATASPVVRSLYAIDAATTSEGSDQSDEEEDEEDRFGPPSPLLLATSVAAAAAADVATASTNTATNTSTTTGVMRPHVIITTADRSAAAAKSTVDNGATAAASLASSASAASAAAAAAIPDDAMLAFTPSPTVPSSSSPVPDSPASAASSRASSSPSPSPATRARALSHPDRGSLGDVDDSDSNSASDSDSDSDSADDNDNDNEYNYAGYDPSAPQAALPKFGPSLSYVNPKLEARVSRTGSGIFALERIEAGETLVVWTGRIITDEQALAIVDTPEGHYLLQIGDGFYQCPLQRAREAADFTNHSCNPNAGFGKNSPVLLSAIRPLEIGDEVKFDYGMCETDERLWHPMRCCCGEPQCRTWITANDWKLYPELWTRYDGYWSPHVQARVDKLLGRPDLRAERQARAGATVAAAVDASAGVVATEDGSVKSADVVADAAVVAAAVPAPAVLDKAPADAADAAAPAAPQVSASTWLDAALGWFGLMRIAAHPPPTATTTAVRA